MQYLACLKEWLSSAKDGISLTISLLILESYINYKNNMETY